MRRANASNPWIQVRADVDEKERALSLADYYGVDLSTLVKAALLYIDTRRPKLVVPGRTIPGKNTEALVVAGD